LKKQQKQYSPFGLNAYLNPSNHYNNDETSNDNDASSISTSPPPSASEIHEKKQFNTINEDGIIGLTTPPRYKMQQ